MFKYRQYKYGDEKLIIKLYKKVFRKELTTQNWQWKYNTYADAGKFIFLAFDKSRCIGQYALIPYRLNSYGKTIQALLSLDSMVDPDYQGRSIFTELMKYARNELLNLKDPSITFINENTIHVYTKKFNWEYLGNIPVYCRPLSLSQLRNENNILYFLLKPFSFIINYFPTQKKYISLHQIKIFDEEIERKCMKDNKLYSMGRTKEFLNWRYMKSPHDYQCFKIMYKGNLIGYCVVRIEEKFDIKLDIEDFVYINDAAGFLKIIKNKINHK